MIYRLLTLLLTTAACFGDGIRLENFTYPYPVKMFAFTNQMQPLEMAYMDPAAAHREKGVIVLLHGKNFSGAYWGRAAGALSETGWRVIIPDQIGFGKSSKPAHYQYSFGQLAANTRELLKSLGINSAVILGHSMGGMLATRYALTYPESTSALLLIDPLGLEDWQAKGVPYATPDQLYQDELHQSPEKLRAYEDKNYYAGQWRPEYQAWVDMIAQFYQSPEYPRMAWNQALTSDMIFTQPVCHEFGNLKMPVLLVVGEKDRTAIGRERVSETRGKLLGHYPELGRQAAATIPNCKLVELAGAGHLPHIQMFPEFFAVVRDFLEAHPAGRAPGK